MQVGIVSFYSSNQVELNLGKSKRNGDFAQTNPSSGIYPNHFHYYNNISFTHNNAKIVKDMANVPCLCCGIKMITPKEFAKLSPVTLSGQGGVAIEALSKFQDNMHDIERICFEKIKAASAKDTSKTLRELLVGLKPKCLKKLQNDQLVVLDKIVEIGRESLSRDSLRKLTDFLSTYRPSVLNQTEIEPFKRKNFIVNLAEFLQKLPEKQEKEKFLSVATRLNKSDNDVNAFIVKYSERKSKETGQRLISSSVKTREHLVAQHSIDGATGTNEDGNVVYTCQRCNVVKTNIPLALWSEEKPEMRTHHAPAYFDFFLDRITAGEITEAYKKILYKQAQTLINGSQGRVMIDIAKLAPETQAFQVAV